MTAETPKPPSRKDRNQISSADLYEIRKYRDGLFKTDRVSLADEERVDIHVDGLRRASVMATPRRLDWLVLGFMFGEGIIDRRNEVRRLDVVGLTVKAETIFSNSWGWSRKKEAGFSTAWPGRALKPARMTADRLLALATEFNSRSCFFQLTGGVHSCCLVDERDGSYFAEDIARHNALDKAVGQYLDSRPEGEPGSGIMLTSGRVSTEFLLKSVRAGCGTIISLGAATDQALELARRFGVTLIGFVRGNNFNIYSGQIDI